MARLETFPEPMRSHLAKLPCPRFETHPWVPGPALVQRRVALISTAGLHRRSDRLFEGMTGEYRVIPRECQANDLIMTHVSTNYDRTGFQQDWNLVFPLDRLKQLAQEGIIESVADYHYSFMGAADPAQMESSARNLAGLLKGDRVDATPSLYLSDPSACGPWARSGITSRQNESRRLKSASYESTRKRCDLPGPFGFPSNWAARWGFPMTPLFSSGCSLQP